MVVGILPTRAVNSRLLSLPCLFGSSSVCVSRFQQPGFSSRGRPEQEYDEEEYAAARQWRSNFKVDSLPRTLANIRFDRSSGAGGQHVNTYNSIPKLRL